jgi:hypothetical protein
MMRNREKRRKRIRGRKRKTGRMVMEVKKRRQQMMISSKHRIKTHLVVFLLTT